MAVKRRGIWRWLLLAAAAVMGLAAVAAGTTLLLLPSVEGLQDRKANLTIQVRDWQGRAHPLVVGPKNRRWTPLGQIPDALKWAVIVAEDGNFYSHEGIDVQALREAIRYDLEKKRLARGASTITQQLAKNLFLSREKTLTRKLKEIVLARRLEKELTKGRILELYLNVAELGPLVHGVGHASRYYFGKPPALLTPRECAFLAAMLPGPRVAYNPYRNLRKVERRADYILRQMRQRGVLSEAEYQLALAGELNIAGMEKQVTRTLETPLPPMPEPAAEIAVPVPDEEAPATDPLLPPAGAAGEEGPGPEPVPGPAGSPPEEPGISEPVPAGGEQDAVRES